MALKDLLRTSDLSSGDIDLLLDLSVSLRDAPYSQGRVLDHETVGCYFAKPSTRTRVSTTAAVVRLGGLAQVLGPGDLQLGRGETIEDTARVLSRYVAAMVIRTFDDTDVARFAAAASIPVVNALTDGHHPLQSLADLLTIRDHFGRLAGLHHAFVGDGCNTAHSAAEAGALTGMHVTLACPPIMQPDVTVIERAQRIAASTGGSVRVVTQATEACRGADIVSTDVWMSMGIDDTMRATRHTALTPFQVDAALMSLASPTAIFLHCLPAHRGEEVTADVIDGASSRVWDQAANRLATTQAVLLALLTGRLSGRPTDA
jgi:ornithine carbamoyltransferase